MLKETVLDKGVYRWPDTFVGSEEYYGIDCGPYLDLEKDTLVNVIWIVPAELEELDTGIIDNIAVIKLKGTVKGTSTITFELNSVDNLDNVSTQKVHEKIKLKVFEI